MDALVQRSASRSACTTHTRCTPPRRSSPFRPERPGNTPLSQRFSSPHLRLRDVVRCTTHSLHAIAVHPSPQSSYLLTLTTLTPTLLANQSHNLSHP
ncbi:uncharacterized protein FOMMEDRAFT_153698 [Fomitiporia mediterranea MF3/22]|uniref:uncharacterized protein n=1 Tax=Fomitiporia mediterranea (strain MF3/22) TaxID=694068 RepID=UPI00044095B4|nr:uncharacterized protein FOMMEDRAFT_153698 [Fomitiporia mediterranea MF3/22]EJD06289.1 hypothetical protein FOMMEDRAFT_153698 [Fomitiporia mediterranea MF3/22]